jgi:hypothetical protein
MQFEEKLQELTTEGTEEEFRLLKSSVNSVVASPQKGFS